MLYVNVTYTMPREHRDRFLAEIQEQTIMELTRQEQGNVAYEFSVPLDNAEQVYLREIWEEEGFEAHKTSDNIKKLGMMKEKYGITTNIVISSFDRS